MYCIRCNTAQKKLFFLFCFTARRSHGHVQMYHCKRHFLSSCALPHTYFITQCSTLFSRQPLFFDQPFCKLFHCISHKQLHVRFFQIRIFALQVTMRFPVKSGNMFSPVVKRIRGKCEPSTLPYNSPFLLFLFFCR